MVTRQKIFLVLLRTLRPSQPESQAKPELAQLGSGPMMIPDELFAGAKRDRYETMSQLRSATATRFAAEGRVLPGKRRHLSVQIAAPTNFSIQRLRLSVWKSGPGGAESGRPAGSIIAREKRRPPTTATLESASLVSGRADEKEVGEIAGGPIRQARGSNRPGGNRTPNRRFWRPVLYQLSYGPTTLAFEPARVADGN